MYGSILAGDRADDGLAVGIDEERHAAGIAVVVIEIGHAGLPVDPELTAAQKAFFVQNLDKALFLLFLCLVTSSPLQPRSDRRPDRPDPGSRSE